MENKDLVSWLDETPLNPGLAKLLRDQAGEPLEFGWSTPAYPEPARGPDGDPVAWVRGSMWQRLSTGEVLHWTYRRGACEAELPDVDEQQT